jgi:3,4-dihydroxy 2-butanone 4-phosphate synthase/GTP cyclohydrolase II
MDPAARPQDLARPGHVFPLRARPGGVLVRSGQTEAAVDLARLAGLSAGGVICEVMNEDGTMARVPQLAEFCGRYGIKMISVADLIRYRLRTETLVQQEAAGRIRTPYGDFEMIRYVSRLNGEAHLALVHGEVKEKSNVLVRVHSRCVYGDVFGSLDCECQQSVGAALKKIVQDGSGVFIYLHQTGPGLRVAWREGHRELLAHGGSHTSPGPLDHHQPLQHEIGLGAQILADLGLSTIRLLTNHPRKIVGVEAFGIQIVDQVPIAVEATEDVSVARP